MKKIIREGQGLLLGKSWFYEISKYIDYDIELSFEYPASYKGKYHGCYKFGEFVKQELANYYANLIGYFFYCMEEGK